MNRAKTIVNKILLKLGWRVSIERVSQDIESSLHSRFPAVQFWASENISIGERVSIASRAYLAADSPISIGNDTMIASGVVLNTNTHRHENHPMWKERISRPIQIGSHVWIGTGAIILPGIKIGDYAVVGAGSVVTRHVPPHTIVADNPAQILKRRGIRNIENDVHYPGGVRFLEFLPEDKSLHYNFADLRNAAAGKNDK